MVAPAALRRLYAAITVGSKQLSGIEGDAKHYARGGYHVPRRYLPPGDYSARLSIDLQGSSENASALDVRLSRGDMILVSQRLLAAGKANDLRLSGMREFFGANQDDTRVIGWDRHDPAKVFDDAQTTSSDLTHLWHVHVGVYRAFSDDWPALAGIAEVINGVPAGGTKQEEEDMTPEQDKMLRALFDRLSKLDVMAFNVNGGNGQAGLRAVIGDMRKQLDAIEAKLDAAP